MSEQPIELKDVAKSFEGLNKAFDEFKSANDERLKELATKDSVDTLLEEKLKRIDDEISKNQEKLDAFAASQKRAHVKYVDKDGNEIDLDKKAHDWARQAARGRGDSVTDFGKKELDEYKSAFIRFVRKGDEIMGPDERKALSVGSDPDGGYLVTPDMGGRIVRRVFETSPMRQYASVQVISTDALEGNFDNDELAANWEDETSTTSNTATPQIGKWRIPVHNLRAAPRATQKLLDDADVSVEAWLTDKMADRFARAEATAFVTGNGAARPRGFTTYADYTTPGVFQVGAIEQFDTGVNGAFAAAPNGGDVLIQALYGLKAQYRANAVWAMNRSTTSLTRRLKDSDGEYIWRAGIAAGQPATLLGYPVAAFEDMADPATGSLSIAVGDFREAYQIVERQGIRVLRDPYSAKPYVEFFGTKRVGGDVVNFEALKLINFQA